MHPEVKSIIKKLSENEWLVEMQDGTQSVWINTKKCPPLSHNSWICMHKICKECNPDIICPCYKYLSQLEIGLL